MEQNKSLDSVEPIIIQPNDNGQPNVVERPATIIQPVTIAQPNVVVQPNVIEQPAVENIQTESYSAQSDSHPAKRIVGVIFSAVEIILGLRLILKLFGANADNTIVGILYGITGFVIKAFEGIFARVTINEVSGAVFEPATLIAMAVFALIALAVLKLMTPREGSSVVKTEYTGPAGQSGQQK